MAVKARWFNEVTVEESDPFDDIGLPIDIGTDEAQLNRRYVDLVEKEGRLAKSGVTCAIKDREDTTCWACPVFRGNTQDKIAPLCNLGREQERLGTRIAVLSMEEACSSSP